MRDVRGVPWPEAGRRLLVCWALCAVMAGVLALSGTWSPAPGVGPLMVMLAQWFWWRHRYWFSGVAAGVAGVVVAFAVVDALRPGLRDALAEPLGVAAGVTVSLAVFTLGSRREAPAAGEARGPGA